MRLNRMMPNLENVATKDILIGMVAAVYIFKEVGKLFLVALDKILKAIGPPKEPKIIVKPDKNDGLEQHFVDTRDLLTKINTGIEAGNDISQKDHALLNKQERHYDLLSVECGKDAQRTEEIRTELTSKFDILKGAVYKNISKQEILIAKQG